MFEDILDEELAKYDRFLSELEELKKRQEIILGDIKVRLLCNLLNKEAKNSIK